MHTSKDDYLINTLRFVSAKEESKIYGAKLPKSIKNHEMRETKAYKTYLGYATGATPPKKARKFKKPASPQLSTVPAPARGDVIREIPEIPLSKKKEKVDVAKGKGIELLSDVALTGEPQYEEGNDEDDSNNEQDSRSEGSDEENDRNITDKAEGDEDEEMHYTTSQLYDDVDIRLNEPVDTDKGFIQYKVLVPLDLSNDTKPYIKLRSSRSVHWDQQVDKRNEMNARGTLLMALLNKDQLKFRSYKDAKLLMESIEKSQLEIQGEVIAQEDMNLKLLRSLPYEWKTHALIWRNKEEI
ncbi:hypothetical protein Tco_1317708 [Tanacetum coccineum]